MSTNNHTAISTGAAANASTINTPLGTLDAAIGNLTALTTTPKTSVAGAIGTTALGTTATTVSGAIAETFANESSNWATHTNIAWIPGSSTGVATVSVSGTTATITIPAGYLVTGAQATAGVALAALGSVALTNTKALYIDVSSPATPAWSSAVDPTNTNIKSSRTRILAVVNFYGRLVSPISGIQAILDRAALYDPIYHDQVSIAVMPTSTTAVATVLKVGTGATITIPECSIATGAHGSPGYAALSALGSTALANTNILYIDMTDPAAPAWSSVSGLNGLKEDRTKVLAVVNWYGAVYSPIPGLAQLLERAQSPTTNLVANSMSSLWLPAGPPEVTIAASGNSVTVSLSSGFLVTGSIAHPGYTVVPALSATTLTNTTALYIDLSVPASPTWSAAVTPTYTNLKGYGDRVLVFVNFYGRLFSPMPSVQSLIDAVEASGTPQTTVTVNAAGGGDYTTIAAAIAAAPGGTASSPAEIYVVNGSYAEYDLTLPAYTNIRGQSREGVIVTGSLGAEDLTKDVFLATTSATMSNLTIIAHNVKYCIHSDSSGEYTLALENCHLKHDTGYAWGIGAWASQNLSATNCIFEYAGSGSTEYGIYFHNWNEQAAACSLTLTGCKFIDCGEVEISELGSDQDDRVVLTNCTTNKVGFGVKMTVDNGYYNGGIMAKADIPYNIKVIVSGGRLPYMVATDRATGWFHAPGVYDEVIENANGSTLAAGTAVAYDYTSTDKQQRVNIASATRCDGVLLANVTTGAQGWMAKRGNSVLALCDTGAISLGDWLKPNATTGQWEAATETTALAVALGTKAGGATGLVKSNLL